MISKSWRSSPTSSQTLPSGLDHVAYAEVTMPAGQMSIQVQNFDYDRNN